MRRQSWWRDILKSNGISFTSVRALVISILDETDKHLSAKEIYMIAHEKNPSIGLTTVYRTLDILTQLGLLQKFQFGDGTARYELLTETNNKEHHHHLVCLCCNSIIDYTEFIEDEVEFIKKTEEGLSKKYNFEIKSHMIRFYGLCENCQNK